MYWNIFIFLAFSITTGHMVWNDSFSSFFYCLDLFHVVICGRVLGFLKIFTWVVFQVYYFSHTPYLRNSTCPFCQTKTGTSEKRIIGYLFKNNKNPSFSKIILFNWFLFPRLNGQENFHWGKQKISKCACSHHDFSVTVPVAKQTSGNLPFWKPCKCSQKLFEIPMLQ